MSNAFLDREPLLAISAQIPDDFPASHTHQLLPLHETYRPIARYVEKITGSNVLDVVPQSLARCMEHRSAVSYLTLSAREALKAAATGAARPVATAPPSSAGAREHATELVSALRSSKRPLVVLWARHRSGERGADPALADGVESAGRRDPKVKGIVDETSANFVGVVGGMAADGSCATRLQRPTWWLASGSIRWKSTRLARRTAHSLAAGIAQRLRDRSAGTALVNHARSSTCSSTSGRRRRGTAPFEGVSGPAARMLTDRHAFGRHDVARRHHPGLASVMPPETIVTTDVGSHKFLFGQYWPSRSRNVLDVERVVGDGVRVERRDRRQARAARGAGAGGGRRRRLLDELAGARDRGACRRAVHHGRARGRQLLADQTSQEGKKLEPYRMDFGPIDTVKIAESCGVASLRTSNPDELAAPPGTRSTVAAASSSPFR